MPKYFTKTEGGEVETIPFNRFHYNEATGNPVPSKLDHPEDAFDLTNAQARYLISEWNAYCERYGHDIVYALSPDHE